MIVIPRLRQLRAVPLLLALAVMSCRAGDLTVEFLTREGYSFSRLERRAIEGIARATLVEVRGVLPALPREIVVRVHAASDVNDAIGASAAVLGANVVYWAVDPRHVRGIVPIATEHLRPMLYHELHHLARRIGTEEMPRRSYMDGVIHEGMATVFARDFGGARYPWSEYPNDVNEWVAELMALPDTAPRDDWMVRHPDGRRWIGYRAGAYLVDRAIRASGLSAAELVSVPPDDVMHLASSSNAR